MFKLIEGIIKIADTAGKLVGIRTDSEGNNRLLVNTLPTTGSSIIPSLGTGLKNEDMNTNTGGISRNTVISNSWTKVYDSTAVEPDATGLLFSIRLNLRKFGEGNPQKEWRIRLVVNNEEVFDPLLDGEGIRSGDLVNPSVYDYEPDRSKQKFEAGGFLVLDDVFIWESPNNLPLAYDSNGVQVYVKKVQDDRSFKAGFIQLTR